jgi:hypothetical protein
MINRLIYENFELDHDGCPTDEELLFYINKTKEIGTAIKLWFMVNKEVYYVMIYKRNSLEFVREKINRKLKGVM